MKKEGIVRRTLGDMRGDRTDWSRIDRMTEAEIEDAANSDPDNLLLDEEFFRRAEIVTPPPKKDIHMRVDEDVLAWFKKQGRGYQTRMNAVLRAYMEAKANSSDRDNSE
ncbi:MAG: BrnA antitoxin family protein [Dehalococcoidia bacterium]